MPAKPRRLLVTLDDDLADLVDALALLHHERPTEAVRRILRAEQERCGAQEHVQRAIAGRQRYRAQLARLAANSPEARRSRFRVVGDE